MDLRFSFVRFGLFAMACICVHRLKAAPPILTGLLNFSTDSSGDATGGQIWTTLNQSRTAHLYVDEGTGIVNHGLSGINVPLTPGVYTFTIIADPGALDTGYAGLNLFFDGDANTPKISVYGRTNSLLGGQPNSSHSTFALDSGLTSDPKSGPIANVSGSGALIFSDGTYSIALSNYGWSQSSIDRVSGGNDVPNGRADVLGSFTLTVSAGPCKGLPKIIGVNVQATHGLNPSNGVFYDGNLYHIGLGSQDSTDPPNCTYDGYVFEQVYTLSSNCPFTPHRGFVAGNQVMHGPDPSGFTSWFFDTIAAPRSQLAVSCISVASQILNWIDPVSNAITNLTSTNTHLTEIKIDPVNGSTITTASLGLQSTTTYNH